MIMFDSLNKHFLPPYGCEWVQAPNFKRLAEKSVVFDNCYAGSLPCMPARRELHTGRNNFLHRSWGPIEPFDESMPEILKKKGIYTHLVSDHYHYWEDGGATYHNRYNSWEIVRGQEGDFWKGEVKDPEIPFHVKTLREGTSKWRQDWINRKNMIVEAKHPQARTFKKGLEFIKTNCQEDNWFLQIETFDPHEPFLTPKKYKDLYEDEYKGPHFDWPNYGVVLENNEQVEHCRKEYAALISMCDNYLGTILNIMDEKDLWKDTLLIVNTDHGFLLGEKGWWAKMIEPIYNEVSHIPLFIWDPRSKKKNERRKALVQTIDLPTTILEFFNIKIPLTMQGKILKETIESDVKVRDAVLFGIYGGHVNITDGKFVYMRAPTNPANDPLYEYTVMPTHMDNFFSINEMKTIELRNPFSFTKQCKLMKIKACDLSFRMGYLYGTLLFDLSKDPFQEDPILDLSVEKMMIAKMIELMKQNDAPLEQYERLGIPYDGKITDMHLMLNENRDGSEGQIGKTEIKWIKKGKSAYSLILSALPDNLMRALITSLEEKIRKENLKEIDEDFIFNFIKNVWPKSFANYYEMMRIIIKEKAI
jgi:arylsulfatase A-like enzyme